MPHTQRLIHGAKWWKMDFHSHTPMSNDFGRGNELEKDITPEQWLLQYMEAEIDCVAVTDHNSGGWINELKAALARLSATKPTGYRPLYLFPGVEISVSSNVHVLAIFGEDATEATITSLLGAVGFRPLHHGTSDAVTSKSIEEVLHEIVALGGIPIPAHVDKPSGLFTTITSGNTLKQIFQTEGLLALEIVDRTYTLPEMYRQSGLQLASVIGTDSHTLAQIGSNFTWVKMHHPSLDALKLALHDGDDGVIRKDSLDVVIDPNVVRNRYFIKSITIKDGFKIGRGTPALANFSPWMTSIIGGRGSGKSSIVNFLRIGLGRHSEMPDPVQQEFDNFFRVGSRNSLGMLSADCNIQIEIFKDGHLYQICWSNSTGEFTFSTKDFTTDTWSAPQTVSDIAALFPVHIFSQKQLYALTDDSSKLLEVVDSQLDKASWQERKNQLLDRWLSIRNKRRQLKQATSQESQLRAQLQLVNNKIAVYEGSVYRSVLSNYKLYDEASRLFSTITSDTASFVEKTDEWQQAIFNVAIPENIAEQLDDQSAGYINQLNSQLEAVKQKSIEILTLLAPYRESMGSRILELPWNQRYNEAKQAYDEIQMSVADQSGDSYESLLSIRADCETKIERVDAEKVELVETEREVTQLYSQIIEHEKNLRLLRRQVIDRLNNSSTDQALIVEIDEMADEEDAEFTLRQLIRKPGEEFARYIYQESDVEPSGLIAEVLREPVATRWQKRQEVIVNFLNATESSSNGYDLRLVRHLQNLRNQTPEDLDRLILWVPNDKISLKLRKEGRLYDIQTGSAGERTAGMLSILLALYNEPLIIDQPEDDLDTRLISNFVVPNIRTLKKERQIIVVTHNPNIAVNGNSENIVHMDFQAGQVKVISNSALQDKVSRQAVCDVMEGGRDALNKRYYRIAKALPAND